MRAWIWKVVDTVRQSYWFIPLAMAVGAVALSIGMVALDQIRDVIWVDRLSWIYANQPSGARALMQTIAGSMITVAGVTFSITIAAVANASAQFGPRLLTNFMNDRGNQITFGTFVATFLYCLLVLRTVRGGDGMDPDELFVPNFAVFGGLAMALASLGVLIYFIHHIPESIHISRMIARVGRTLMSRIDTLYPSKIGERTTGDETPAEAVAEARAPMQNVIAIRAAVTGFVQRVEETQLMTVAREKDLVLWILKNPGAFATPETTMVLVKPADLVDDHVANRIRSSFIVGTRRTSAQDAMFPASQLVEVAARALSPGMNDPFTATSCIDWLIAAVERLAGREIPSPYRFDDGGTLRIVAPPVDFDEFAGAVFGQLRPYVQRDRNASLHLLECLRDLLGNLRTQEQRATIWRVCQSLREGCFADLPHADDRDDIDHIFKDAASRWGDPATLTSAAENGEEKATIAGS